MEISEGLKNVSEAWFISDLKTKTLRIIWLLGTDHAYTKQAAVKDLIDVAKLIHELDDIEIGEETNG